MTAEDVVAIYDRCEKAGIRVWIDGGWAVDALLGRETRPHADLDIAIEQKDVPRLRRLLADYHDVPRDDTKLWNFVLGDDHDRRVDIHAIVFDATGIGILGPPENGNAYPAGSLDGSGVIAGRTVRCIAPEFLVQFHTGYPIRDSDRHDVGLLCERFGLPLPEGYR